MRTPLPPSPHHWVTPGALAALCEARPTGAHWRAACPAHGGDNPTALKISQGVDQYGHACTLVHCFAQQCAVEDICAALGLAVRHLFSVQPDYARQTARAPRSGNPLLKQVMASNVAPDGDWIAMVMLEDIMTDDPAFLEACAPARHKLWELGQASSAVKNRFFRVLSKAGQDPRAFWSRLMTEQKANANGNTTAVPDPLGDPHTEC
jgi:hypothetical protein